MSTIGSVGATFYAARAVSRNDAISTTTTNEPDSFESTGLEGVLTAGSDMTTHDSFSRRTTTRPSGIRTTRKMKSPRFGRRKGGRH